MDEPISSSLSRPRAHVYGPLHQTILLLLMRHDYVDENNMKEIFQLACTLTGADPEEVLREDQTVFRLLSEQLSSIGLNLLMYRKISVREERFYAIVNIEDDSISKHFVLLRDNKAKIAQNIVNFMIESWSNDPHADDQVKISDLVAAVKTKSLSTNEDVTFVIDFLLEHHYLENPSPDSVSCSPRFFLELKPYILDMMGNFDPSTVLLVNFVTDAKFSPPMESQ